MTYWIKRIILKSGELVTERDLEPNENRFEGPAPVVGDRVAFVFRGQDMLAEVIWGNWPQFDGLVHPKEVTPVRVAEIYRDLWGRSIVAKQKFEAAQRSSEQPSSNRES